MYLTPLTKQRLTVNAVRLIQTNTAMKEQHTDRFYNTKTTTSRYNSLPLTM